jgi:hypothetical protein
MLGGREDDHRERSGLGFSLLHVFSYSCNPLALRFFRVVCRFALVQVTQGCELLRPGFAFSLADTTLWFSERRMTGGWRMGDWPNKI